MDIHMPVMDGLEAAAKITALGVKTPIVAVTANIMSSDMEYYKNSGMFDTLGKPFTSNELWKCLIKYIPVESYSTISKQSKNKDDDLMLKQLSLNFVRYNRDMYAEIVSALDNDDIKTAHRLAHALKGNAGQLKKTQLQTAAADVEEMLNNGENRLDQYQLDILESEFMSVLDDFSPLLEEFEAQKQIKITDEDRIREIFDKLEPLLINSNPDSVDFIGDIHRIEGAEVLAEKIEDFRFPQALEELNKLRDARGWNE
jgi:CheY-like chemotaxis protein